MEPDTTTQIMGIAFILIGATLRYFVGRSRFNRRSVTGAQVFKTYEHYVIKSGFEKLITLIAICMIVFGLFAVFVGYTNQKRIDNARSHSERKQ